MTATVHDQLKDPVDSHLKGLSAYIEQHTEDASLRQRVAEL